MNVEKMTVCDGAQSVNAMTAEDNLKLFFSEYMAGGFDEEWVKPEVKQIFSEVEEILMEDENAQVPSELVARWNDIDQIYL